MRANSDWTGCVCKENTYDVFKYGRLQCDDADATEMGELQCMPCLSCLDCSERGEDLTLKTGYALYGQRTIFACPVSDGCIGATVLNLSSSRMAWVAKADSYFDEKTISQPDFWAKSVIQAVFLPLREDPTAPSADTAKRWPGYGSVEGRLLRAPILRAFADARAPEEVREWVKSISEWPFERILTAHFASPIKATPSDFAAAFSYLDDPQPDEKIMEKIACEDWKLLDGLNDLIETNKLGAPVKFDFKPGCPRGVGGGGAHSSVV